MQGYVVGYGEGVPEVNWQYLEGNRTNMTIKNLSLWSFLDSFNFFGDNYFLFFSVGICLDLTVQKHILHSLLSLH